MSTTEVGETVRRSPAALDEDERSLWFAWKRAHEVIRARMSEAVRSATGLSDADVAILVHVADCDGQVRQSSLAARLGWDRTRLSHQISRMVSRGLVARDKSDSGVEVDLTDAGRDALGIVQPIHAEAVREHLIAPFTAGQVEHLRAALDRISAPRSGGETG